MTSPPARLAKALQTALATPSPTNRQLPSILRHWTPPGGRLLAETAAPDVVGLPFPNSL